MNVIIPTSLRQHTGGASQVAVNGESVESAIIDLVDQHPDLKSRILDETGILVSHINVFVNDQNIRDLQNGATPLRESDEILLVPAIAGG